MLIPLYILIGVSGAAPAGRARRFKFVIYTMVGSLLMLAAVIVYGLQAGTFSMIDGGTNASSWIFLGFAAAFIVKAPLFPFHGWLPRRLPRVPGRGVAVLSGVVSKRRRLASSGSASRSSRRACTISGRRSSCCPQSGSSTVASGVPRTGHPRGIDLLVPRQMGLIVLGLFATNNLGINARCSRWVNHGLISAVLFMLAAPSSGGRRPDASTAWAGWRAAARRSPGADDDRRDGARRAGLVGVRG